MQGHPVGGWHDSSTPQSKGNNVKCVGEGHVTLKAFISGLESYFLPVTGSGFWLNALLLCASSAWKGNKTQLS